MSNKKKHPILLNMTKEERDMFKVQADAEFLTLSQWNSRVNHQELRNSPC